MLNPSDRKVGGRVPPRPPPIVARVHEREDQPDDAETN